jgi:hypothetical protein
MMCTATNVNREKADELCSIWNQQSGITSDCFDVKDCTLESGVAARPITPLFSLHITTFYHSTVYIADMHVHVSVVQALTIKDGGDFQHILRILGTNVDGRQKVMYAMTSVKGIGRRFSNIVCKKADVDMDKRAGEFRCSSRVQDTLFAVEGAIFPLRTIVI